MLTHSVPNDVHAPRLASSPRALSEWAATRLLGAACTIALASCVVSDSLPGTSLGTYQVVATLGANSCGAGVAPKNPWRFTVELSKDGTTLYLANTDGTDEVSGPFATTDETSATLVSAVTENVNATGAAPCNLTLSTSYALSLPAGSPPATFSGTASYDYSVASAVSSSTDCTAQLASNGGKYTTLPCTVNYKLNATRQ